MVARRTAARVLAAPDEWSRRKLQAALVVLTLVLGALVAGVAWTVVDLLASDHTAADPEPAGGEDPATREDQAVSIENAQPGPLAAATVQPLRIPQPGTLGAAQVGTGFRRTSQGAMAQLVAIDQRAIQSGSLVTAQDVIGAWAEPGGPTPESWSAAEAVALLLEAAGLPATGATDLHVELRPAMGLIRHQAEDVVTPCVNFVLTVMVPTARPVRIAVADCQRMVWRGSRWVIGAGAEPQPSPSAWPGSQASYDAGYQWLEVEP
jgi:hypothetical protein